MTNIKLKVLPGRGLTGKDIKKRLRNRTLEGEVFGKDAYLIDKEMDSFMKMSKVEQINAARENQKKINEANALLDAEYNAKKAKLEEARLEAEVQKRLNAIRDADQSQSPTNVPSR